MLSNIEYITLRLVRKFLFSRDMLNRWVGRIPYYCPTVAQFDPESALEKPWSWGHALGLTLEGKDFLELGSGAANGVGYAGVARGAGSFCCFEPFVPFHEARDRALRERYLQLCPDLKSRVRRVTSLEGIEPARFDWVISTAVLEHVYDLDALLTSLRPLLRPGFQMLHVVDYRDHFFKYPLHFLQFSDEIWQRFLDPGNMPRPRVLDHVNGFRRHGFAVDILERTLDRDSFRMIRPRLAPRFQGYPEEDLATTFAVLHVREGTNGPGHPPRAGTAMLP